MFAARNLLLAISVSELPKSEPDEGGIPVCWVAAMYQSGSGSSFLCQRVGSWHVAREYLSVGFVFSLVNDQGFWGPRNGALKGGGRDYGRMGNAFRNCRKAYSPGINLAGKAIAKGSDRPIAI